MSEAEPVAWHALTADEAVERLKSSVTTGLDDSEAAVVRNFGAPNWIGAECAAHDRVARRDGERTDDDLTRIDRQEPKLLHVDRRGVADEPPERAAVLRACEHAWRLRLQHRAATQSGGARLEQMAA